MPAGAAGVAFGLIPQTLNPWTQEGPGSVDGSGPFPVQRGPYGAAASMGSGSAFATPPAAFLEPRRSIQTASRETQMLIAM
jgi:hypothetical protein